ncbi:MAG: hypothetical protein WAV95_04510 [Azonexus sp.]
MSWSTAHRRVAALLSAILLGSAAIAWLQAEHEPSAPIEVAQAFLAHLEARQVARAYELTTQSGPLGSTLGQFETLASRLPYGNTRLLGSHPFQTNGNRLRRWAAGREIEMPEVHVEFSGQCLLRVTLRRTLGGQWRVSKLSSHAG